MVGDVYRLLVTGAETGGRYCQWEAVVPPGGGPPPHVHTREEEGFLVLEGELTFYAGSEKIVAGPGTFLNMPIGQPHCFKNESTARARMIITIAPAGLEEMFLEIGQSLPEGTTEPVPPAPDEIPRLLAAAPRYGVEIFAPAH